MRPIEDKPVKSAIQLTRTLITRQRQVISERSAHGKPVEALRPVLSEMESNLDVLNRLHAFLEERRQRTGR